MKIASPMASEVSTSVAAESAVPVLPSGYVKITCGPFPSENIKSFKEGAGTPLEKKRSGDTAETSMSQAKKKSQKKVDLRAYEYVQKSRVSIHNIYICV
jgi:hypothetical protein